MKIKRKFILMFITILVLQGCTENFVSPQEVSITISPSVQETTKPYQAPTGTPEIAISETAPYIPLTITPDTSIATKLCMNNGIPIHTPPDMRVQGAILYKGLN